MKSPFQPCDCIAIPANGKGYFYALICMGSDLLFLDKFSQEIVPVEELQKSRYLMRLSVSYVSLKRSKCKKVGVVPMEGEVAIYGKYLNTPVGSSTAFVLDKKDASLTPATPQQIDALEIAAVWDMEYHIIPILHSVILGGEPASWQDMIKVIKKKT